MDLKIKDNIKLSLFTQLEYIESTGTQYIDTGYKPNQGTRVVVEIEVGYTQEAHLFGERDGWASNWFGIECGNDTNAFYGHEYSTVSISKNVKHKIDFDKNVLKLNGATIKTFNAQVWSSNTNLAINVLYENGGTPAIKKVGKNKFYSFKVYDNDTLVRDFIPAKDINGVVCLYDTVSKTFFYNQGTGDFVAGPVVKQGLPGNILLRTTTFYHENTPNIDGLSLLNSILNYQKTHQDEIKADYYSKTPLWQSIIETYPNIGEYCALNKRIVVVVCEDADPYAKASEISGYADNIVQTLTS